jgi:hypothetical protein
LIYSVLHNGRLFYVHSHDFEPEYYSYFVRETNQDELQSVKDNKIELRQFLLQSPELYIVRIYGDGKPLQAWKVNPEEFEDNDLPDAGCFLYHTQKEDQLP